MPTRSILLVAAVAMVTAAMCSEPRATRDRGPRRATACGDSTAISWEPTAPRQGALFRVRVSGVPTGATLSGIVAGEALHFSPVAGTTSVESLAAVPINAADSLGIQVLCNSGERTDTLRARLATTRGEYPVERLTVAPTFGRPPDSALAARMKREADRANAVAVASHETPRLWTKPFLHPRDSRITSGFGRGSGVQRHRHVAPHGHRLRRRHRRARARRQPRRRPHRGPVLSGWKRDLCRSRRRPDERLPRTSRDSSWPRGTRSSGVR